MDAAAAQAFVTYLSHQRGVADYVFLGAIGVIVYDWLINLGDEVNFIWNSRWTYTKILYLLIRYIPLVAVYFVCHNQLLPNVTLDNCKWAYPTLLWLVLVTIIFSEFVLLIRTWVIWRRNKVVGVMMIVAWIGVLVSACYCNSVFARSLLYVPPPYVGFRGCFIAAASPILTIDFIVLMGLQALVLCLMVISAFRTHRGGLGNDLATVIHRDGILFYVYLMGVTLINVICMKTLPVDLEMMVCLICWAFYSTLTCRVVLNIRRVAKQTTVYGVSELHTLVPGYSTTEPMEFRPNYMEGGASYAVSGAITIDEDRDPDVHEMATYEGHHNQNEIGMAV